MAEKWTRKVDDMMPVDNKVEYEVKAEVVVRKVNKKQLLEEKTRLEEDIARTQAEIVKIDTDLTKFDELEALEK